MYPKLSNYGLGARKPRPWIVCGRWWALATMWCCFLLLWDVRFWCKFNFFLRTGGFGVRRTRESSIHKNPLKLYETMLYSLQAQQKQQQRIRSLEVPKLRIQNVDMRTGRIWSYLLVFGRFMLQDMSSGFMRQESMGARLRKLEHGGSNLFLGHGKNGMFTEQDLRWLWKSDTTRRFLWWSDQAIGTDKVFEKGDWSAHSIQKSLWSDSCSLYLHSVVLDLLCFGSNLGVSNIQGVGLSFSEHASLVFRGKSVTC